MILDVFRGYSPRARTLISCLVIRGGKPQKHFPVAIAASGRATNYTATLNTSVLSGLEHLSDDLGEPSYQVPFA